MSSIDLPKYICVENDILTLAQNLVRLFGIVFLLINGLWLDKGYQETDIGTGRVFTQVIGWADTRDRTDLPAVYRRVWNAADISGPVQDKEALFIMTNAIITPEQQLRNCPEDETLEQAECSPANASNCIKGMSVPMNGNGIMTGRCVPAINDQSNKSHTCEVTGWCPVERSTFPTNSQMDMSDSDIEVNCKDDQADHWRCPIFKIDSMIKQAGIFDFHLHDIAREGGIISVTIKWDCNFDPGHKSISCKPKYLFKQLENYTSPKRTFWNFRYKAAYSHINEYRDANNTLTRDVFKKAGVVFIINVDAKAGRYDWFTTFIRLGAAFGYFKLAPALCGIIVSVAATLYRFFLDKNAISKADEGDADALAMPPSMNIQLIQNIKDLKEVFTWLTKPWITILLFIIGILILTLITFIVIITKAESALVDWTAWCAYSLIVPGLLFCLLIYIPDLKLATFFSNFSFIKGLILLAVTFVGLVLQVGMMYLLGIFADTEIQIHIILIRLPTAIAGDVLIGISLFSLIPVLKIAGTWFAIIFSKCGHNCNDCIKSAEEAIIAFLHDMFNLDEQLNEEMSRPTQRRRSNNDSNRLSIRKNRRDAVIGKEIEMNEILKTTS